VLLLLVLLLLLAQMPLWVPDAPNDGWAQQMHLLHVPQILGVGCANT
jgi:hypothetical protein